METKLEAKLFSTENKISVFSSIDEDIVEGSNRQYNKEYLQLLYISKGSIAESDYLLNLSNRLGFLIKEDYVKIKELLDRTTRTLHSFLSAVEKERFLV